MPSTTERGYGNEHQKRRERERPFVESGAASCWRCGQPIVKGEAWDLGHDDNDRTQYNGPEHVKCNRATKGHRTTIIADDSRLW